MLVLRVPDLQIVGLGPTFYRFPFEDVCFFTIFAMSNLDTDYFMKHKTTISRRSFLSSTALGAAALLTPLPSLAREKEKRGKSGFCMWQIPSHQDTIGNSYVFLTDGGKVVVMDGGFDHEALFLRGFIGALGGEVEAWFVSHPHPDHMGALNEILKAPGDISIKTIYHSRMPEEVIMAEPQCEKSCHEYYQRFLDQTKTRVVDIQEPGETFCFDGMKIKILSVANDFTTNPYNNSSMIMRVWDKRKSIVFLGDAGIECGDKVLAGPFAPDLNCDYLQMAHHGQNGCSEEFYRSIKFSACLWPTPTWVWNNDQGKGFDTGILNTVRTREWMERLNIDEHHVTCLDGIFKLD